LIYLFGGIDDEFRKLNDIFSFNLETKLWKRERTKGTSPSPRCDHVGVTYGNKIIFVGGSDEQMNFLTDVHVFDTVENTWNQPVVHGVPPSSRIACCSTRLGNKMFIFGGGLWDVTSQNYVEGYSDIFVLNLDEYTWYHPKAKGDIPSPKDNKFSSLITVGNHLFLEIGRISSTDTGYCSSYVFDTVTETWSKLKQTNLNVLTNNCSSCNVIGSKAFYFGGNRGRGSNEMLKLNLNHLQEFL